MTKTESFCIWSLEQLRVVPPPSYLYPLGNFLSCPKNALSNFRQTWPWPSLHGLFWFPQWKGWAEWGNDLCFWTLYRAEQSLFCFVRDTWGALHSFAFHGYHICWSVTVGFTFPHNRSPRDWRTHPLHFLWGFQNHRQVLFRYAVWAVAEQTDMTWSTSEQPKAPGGYTAFLSAWFLIIQMSVFSPDSYIR